MKKKTNFIIFEILISIIQIQAKNSYHITNGVKIDKTNFADLTQLEIMLPYAQTNQ